MPVQAYLIFKTGTENGTQRKSCGFKRLGRRIYGEGKNIVEVKKTPGTPWINVSRTEKLVDGFALTWCVGSACLRSDGILSNEESSSCTIARSFALLQVSFHTVYWC